jgi:glyoxylase-like metal-dependent hydrolase (beta-lactamase superfamily II)
MKELAPNIFYIPGENDSRFPYCACLYLKGKKLRVLIDAGMGSKNLAPVKKMGIDLLILTHCHIDHRLTIRDMPDVPVWCHETETIYLKDREFFFTAAGFKRSGLDLSRMFELVNGMFELNIDRELTGNEQIELGGMTLEVIHTPGHTPGHLSFVVPEHRLVFSGDIDLTPFGPFYGHDFGNIDDFLDSIQKLIRRNAEVIATGHAGPFNGHTAERLEAYGQIIYHRDRLLLKHLIQPRSVENLKSRNLFYKYYPDPTELIQWFEWVLIEKHLRRLTDSEKVNFKDGLWQKR